MKKWIALVLVVIAFTAAARAVVESGKANSLPYDYYDWDYPRTLLFKGVAMTKSQETYPVLLLATESDNEGFWSEDSDAKFFFILNGEVQEMSLESLERKDDNSIVVELEGEGEMVLLIRYQRYYNQVSVSGVYNNKYLLNLGLANNQPVYRLMDSYVRAEPAPENDGWIQETVTKAIGGHKELPEESEIEDLW